MGQINGQSRLWTNDESALIGKELSILLTPCWSVLEFWKIKLEKSSSTNWIFSLQKSISKLIFAGYTGSKNPVRNRLKIQFVELDFSKLIFQKSSTDQQGASIHLNNRITYITLFSHFLQEDVFSIKIKLPPGNTLSL